jgi:mRNA-degrading endonuclease RelE of RelBE toxin-antitoxin system
VEGVLLDLGETIEGGSPPSRYARSLPARASPARTARAGAQGDVESAVAYDIRFSDEADEHMAELTARQRARVLDAVDRQLLHEPTKETRNRKRMQPDKTPFVAPWELRVDAMRVYYDVEEEPKAVVKITAVGIKVRNRILIAGREIEP